MAFVAATETYVLSYKICKLTVFCRKRFIKLQVRKRCIPRARVTNRLHSMNESRDLNQ